MESEVVPLALAAAVARDIRDHARRTYPDECCGALLGRGSSVVEAYALPNTTEEGPRRRFLVRPEDYRATEARARASSADVLGFYHSHPDHPARPSQYDLDHAWPVFSYVIVSVAAGDPGEMRSWVLRDDRAAFGEQSIGIRWESTKS